MSGHPADQGRIPSTGPPFTSAHISQVEALPAAGTLLWRPLRRHLGIEAFGINAYVAREPGDEVVENHDELAAGAGHHEELYLVLEGHARFMVAGQAIDAPAGTFVFVRDPAARRHATAVAPDTTVLAIGAPRGAAFRVAPWEYSFAADVSKQAGDLARARELIAKGLDNHPENPSLLYNRACYEALDGDTVAALAHLRRALELDPKLTRYVPTDSDLDPIRDHPDFPRQP